MFGLGFAGLAAPLLFVAVVLGGPHSDLLPGVLQPVVVMMGWAALLGVPSWLAARAYRWQMRRDDRGRR